MRGGQRHFRAIVFVLAIVLFQSVTHSSNSQCFGTWNCDAQTFVGCTSPCSWKPAPEYLCSGPPSNPCSQVGASQAECTAHIGCQWISLPQCPINHNTQCNSDSQCSCPAGYSPSQYPSCFNGKCCKPNGASCASASQCCSKNCDAGNCKSATGGGSPWYGGIYFWTLLAATISASLIALMYMVGKFFELPPLEAWVKIELQELGVSFVIAVVCVVLIASVNEASRFLAGENGGHDITSLAIDALYRVYSDGKSLYLKLTEAYFHIARISSFSYLTGVSYSVVSLSVSSSPGSGLSSLVAEVGQGMDGVSNFMMLAAAQASFLYFFKNAATVMLPVGIFLRSFSFTRKVGGVVLAATICFSVIYPAAFLISGAVYDAFSSDLKATINNISVPPSKNPPAVTLVCNPYMQMFVNSPLPFPNGETGWWLVIATPYCLPLLVFGGAFGECMRWMFGLLSQIFYIIKVTFPYILTFAMLDYVAGIIGPVDSDSYLDPAIKYMLPAVGKYGVLSLMVFLIPLIIAMPLLRNLSIMFGGEPQLYGVSKLI